MHRCGTRFLGEPLGGVLPEDAQGYPKDPPRTRFRALSSGRLNRVPAITGERHTALAVEGSNKAQAS